MLNVNFTLYSKNIVMYIYTYKCTYGTQLQRNEGIERKEKRREEERAASIDLDSRPLAHTYTYLLRSIYKHSELRSGDLECFFFFSPSGIICLCCIFPIICHYMPITKINFLLCISYRFFFSFTLYFSLFFLLLFFPIYFWLTDGKYFFFFIKQRVQKNGFKLALL